MYRCKIYGFWISWNFYIVQSRGSSFIMTWCPLLTARRTLSPPPPPTLEFLWLEMTVICACQYAQSKSFLRDFLHFLMNYWPQWFKKWLIIALFSMHTVTESFVILTNFLANPGNVSTYKKRVVSLAVFESFRQIQSWKGWSAENLTIHCT